MSLISWFSGTLGTQKNRRDNALLTSSSQPITGAVSQLFVAYGRRLFVPAQVKEEGLHNFSSQHVNQTQTVNTLVACMLAFNIARSVKFLSILIANTLIMLYACALLQLVTVSMVDEIRFTYSTAKILTTSLSPLRNAANVF